MPLQNRVTPFSEIVMSSMRGLFMGNRGVLHDDARMLRTARFRGKRWIVCSLAPRGAPRPIMAPGRYTELFFLDEAVAFAAGHRPCAECRRDAFRRFAAGWATGMARASVPSATELDADLHAARLTEAKAQKTGRSALSDVPDGAFVQRGDEAWLVHDGRVLRWSLDGYDRDEPISRWSGDVVVLTPAPSVSALRGGYRPVLHASAFI